MQCFRPPRQYGTTGSSSPRRGLRSELRGKKRSDTCGKEPVMATNTRFVGLDVHAETIAVAVAEGRGKVQALGTIPNRPEAVRRLLGKVGKPSELRVCYEAGPTGYALYWQLTAMGIACEVIAPSLAPSKPGDRVKTD